MLRPMSALLVLSVFAMLAIAGCGGGGNGLGQKTKGPDLAPEIQVYAVDFRYRTRHSNNPLGFSEIPLDSDPAIPLLARATVSLDMAIPMLTRQELVDQLIALAVRGVPVRIVTEKASFDDPAQKPFYDQLGNVTLTQGNIQIRTDNEGLPRQMGCRFFVVDRTEVVCASFPFESSEFDQTMGDVIHIVDVGVADAFSAVFEDMFQGAFGTKKFPPIQHVFLLGQGGASLEIYFLPNDNFYQIVSQELELANVVFAFQEQWGDFALARTLGEWVINPLPPNSLFPRVLGVFINDISVDPLVPSPSNPNQDLSERQVDEYFSAIATGALGPLTLSGVSFPEEHPGLFYYGRPVGGSIDNSTPPGVNYTLQNTMGHSFIVFQQSQFHLINPNLPTGDDEDPGGVEGRAPLVPVFNNWQELDSTVLWTDASFGATSLVQDDQVVLIMRGEPLTSKFLINDPYLISTLIPSSTEIEAKDLQVVDQLVAMMPIQQSPLAPPARQFAGLSCGIVVGEISNFSHAIELPTVPGETPQEIIISVEFRVEGEYYFGGSYPQLLPLPLDNPFVDGISPFLDGQSHFDHNPLSNPDSKFFMYVPAGEVTIYAFTVDLEGNLISEEFSTSTVEVGPGGVVSANLNIVPPSEAIVGGGGGGGGF